MRLTGRHPFNSEARLPDLLAPFRRDDDDDAAAILPTRVDDAGEASEAGQKSVEDAKSAEVRSRSGFGSLQLYWFNIAIGPVRFVLNAHSSVSLFLLFQFLKTLRY